MPRIRSIKPEFFLHEDLTDLSPLTRILFVGLWCLADKEGRLNDRPRTIKAQALPFDEVDVDKALWDLVGIDCITRYCYQDANFIQINNWEKHQRPHHTERQSDLPPMDNGEVTVRYRKGKERKGRERKGKEGKGEAARRDKPAEAAAAWHRRVHLDKNYEWDGFEQADLDFLKESFPRVDLDKEFNKMASWIRADPKRRKKNWAKFIHNWLSKSQDRGY